MLTLSERGYHQGADIFRRLVFDFGCLDHGDSGSGGGSGGGGGGGGGNETPDSEYSNLK